METKPEDVVLTLKYLSGETNGLSGTDLEVNYSPEAINAGTEVEMLYISCTSANMAALRPLKPRLWYQRNLCDANKY